MLSLLRQQLDAQINELRAFCSVQRPSKGWIKTIRQAIGISTKQIAKKLHMSQQAFSKIEHAEASMHITMKTLEKAAQALNCRLVYVLIPEKPLEEVVLKQMGKKVDEIIDNIHHSMALEDQSTNIDVLRQEKENLMASFKQKKNISFIWD